MPMRDKKELVQNLKNSGYLNSQKVVKAFMDIPREGFIPEESRNYAYADRPLLIGNGQTISAPHMVAMMTELLEPEPRDKVLEVGGGSGYQAAILSRLVKRVYSVEVDLELVSFAKANLRRVGISNVEMILGDGSRGYPKEKPYDKIIVTCATPKIFDSWTSQLKTEGILLAPVGGGFYQELIKIRKTRKGLEKRNHGGCAFVPLRH
jgi:protein-L-isoaspartate(D-aspartate) O-methyltransferase